MVWGWAGRNGERQPKKQSFPQSHALAAADVGLSCWLLVLPTGYFYSQSIKSSFSNYWGWGSLVSELLRVEEKQRPDGWILFGLLSPPSRLFSLSLFPPTWCYLKPKLMGQQGQRLLLLPVLACFHPLSLPHPESKNCFPSSFLYHLCLQQRGVARTQLREGSLRTMWTQMTKCLLTLKSKGGVQQPIREYTGW